MLHLSLLSFQLFSFPMRSQHHLCVPKHDWNQRSKAKCPSELLILAECSSWGSLSETQRVKDSQNQQKEANLWGFPPAGKSSLKQIIHSPCNPKHGCFKRMRAQQRSCLYGREKWSERRPWPYTGYPRNLNNGREKENSRERKGENAEHVTYKQQLQTVKEKQNKAKQKATCGWQWSMLTSHSFL